LDIAVLKKKVDNNAYDGEPIAWTNDFNVYNAQGQLDGLRQRVYCTLTNDNGAYVRLTSRDPHNVVDYSVRVFRARPVILVHGIESHPLDDQDEESTLGHFALVAPWDAAMPPCQAYAFPWNSKQNNIEMDTNVGIGFAFVNYVNGTYAKHGATPAVLIGHSMGGYLCRIYMHGEESALRWSHCFLLSSPQYGSDIANAVPGCISRSWWSQTSAYNIQALRRGSEHVRIMIEWSGDIGAKVICIAGTDSNFSKYDWKLATAVNMNAFYHNGLHQSDCVVPNSSALLANARCLTVPMNHHRIGVFTDHEDSTDPRNTMRDAVYQHIRNVLIE
jgi:pimeloyl-ACP methyl ester carboxylesterase